MRQTSRVAVAVAGLAATAVSATSLSDLCTVANVKAALPVNGTINGIDLIPSSVTASAVTNSSSSGTSGKPAGIGRRQAMGTGSSTFYPYCNVTVAYTHTGKGDKVVLKLAFPEPASYKNRFYVAGGGAYSLNTDATGGLEYGAAAGATDAGYDALNGVAYDDVNLYGNGSINWDATHMFGYQALGELTRVGKAITPALYGSTNSSKLYTYYEGCSDGGREGMSQVQRFGELYDGAITGAPAFRYAHQQVNHVYSALVEYTQDYYPPPCELAKIVNATIKACDPLDGRTDGVIGRTDLCKLHFNISSIIGEPYYCAATTSTSLGLGFSTKNKRQAAGSETSTTPAQNGTVSAQGVAVAQAIIDGLHNSKGERAYLSWQIGSEFGDAGTSYNNATGKYGLDISGAGGEFITKFVQLVDLDNLSSFDGVTYDTLVEWMNIAYNRYFDTLQTTVPDLTPFKSHGGKLLHYHGESDPSVPSASSVHYWQSVRSIMREKNLEDFGNWYQLYLIPGGAHCNTNDLQPGPWPENNMKTMIDWVEGGVKPNRLNSTVQSGDFVNEVQMLCQWPTRPLWHGNGSNFDCVSDAKSIESWNYEFPAFKVPIY